MKKKMKKKKSWQPRKKKYSLIYGKGKFEHITHKTYLINIPTFKSVVTGLYILKKHIQ